MGLVSAVRGFVRWWVGELAGMLPAGLRRAAHSRMVTFKLSLGGDDIVAMRCNGTPGVELGRVPRVGGEGEGFPAPGLPSTLADALQAFDAARTRVLVEVPAQSLLSRSVQLPLAAEENLARVLSYEMGRQSPFSADEVYFDYRLVKREPAAQRLEVLLSLIPRRVVDEALSRVVPAWEMRPAASGFFQRNDDGTCALVFLPASYRATGALRLNAGLAVANVVVLAILVAMTLAGQRATMARLDGQLKVVRAEALSVAAMRESLDVRNAGLARLRQFKLAPLPVVEVVNELSVLLDDATWLNRLEIKDDLVHVQGTSEAASALIARLEASEMFKGARFRSPVTQAGATGRERFHLTVEIARRGGQG